MIYQYRYLYHYYIGNIVYYVTYRIFSIYMTQKPYIFDSISHGVVWYRLFIMLAYVQRECNVLNAHVYRGLGVGVGDIP